MILRTRLGGFTLATIFSLVLTLSLSACSGAEETDGRPLVVTTTMMLEDAVNRLAGDHLNVVGLMGPGVDPHLYRATPRDIRNLDRADLIIYNGLFLEARLSEILEKIEGRTFAAAEVIPEEKLIAETEFGGVFDPHVWFDVNLWKLVTTGVAEQLVQLIPEHEEEITHNKIEFLEELDALHTWVYEQIQQIPAERRFLITAHDAFGYFGQAYNIEVKGLQGLNTQTEVGIQDITRMVRFIIDNEIPAIFLETSIAPRPIQSLENGVRERGGSVELGGELFSDAMGERGTEKGTYIGMFRYNVEIITNALKK